MALGLPPARYDVPAVSGVRLAVVDLGTACCAVEVVAAVGLGLLVPVTSDGGEAARTVLVVAGTVTDVLLPAVLAAADEVAAEAVVALGVCTISGGPYWDSYAVAKGIDQVMPVAAYVPGCPPRPQALVSALADLADRLVRA